MDELASREGLLCGALSIETYNAANRGKRFVQVSEGQLDLLHDLDLDRAGSIRDANNPLYPFKRVVVCPQCRKPFLGSASRSRSGRHIPAYHCARKHPRIARNKVSFEAAVHTYIAKLRFHPMVINALAEALHQRFRERQAELEEVAATMARSVSDLEAEKAETVRAFKNASSDVMRRALEADMERLDVQIANGATQRRQSELTEGDLTTYLRDLSEIMEHPSILLEKPENMLVQRTRFDMTFDELPTITEIENGTPKLSPIMMICEGEDDPQSVLVRLRGLDWNHFQMAIKAHMGKETHRPALEPRRRPGGGGYYSA